ncbi:MAG: DEAD/DEAH box helicase [Chlamydiae bacterium]|nr:DEAD/DEAH box helicase [Chlamydiota bacterium]
MTIVFSDRTYQVEIDGTWVFLQLGEGREAVDRFCNCDKASEFGNCEHIGLAIDRIYGDTQYPLHKRYAKSLEEQIAFLLYRRHGMSPVFEQKQDQVEINLQNQNFFRMTCNDESIKKILYELLFERVEENEANSIKFSNLPLKELEMFRRRRPSDRLSFELSPFQDLFKTLFTFGETPTITVLSDERGQPSCLRYEKKSILIEVAMGLSSWLPFISLLYGVAKNIGVFPYRDRQMETMRFNPGGGTLEIHTKKIPMDIPSTNKRFDMGAYEWIEGFGFLRKTIDPLILSLIIQKNEVGFFLSRNLDLAKKFLKEPIHTKPISLHHRLSFDQDESLVIHAYLFEERDLEKIHSHLYQGWAFIEKKGFYRILPTPFNEVCRVIKKADVYSFIEKHRIWLQDKSGFQIHSAAIEANLTYKMFPYGLSIEPEKEEGHLAKGLIDLGFMIYVEGSGFFPKIRGNNTKAAIKKMIPLDEIAPFIRDNKDECDTIRRFFIRRPILNRCYLNVTLNKFQQILITPVYETTCTEKIRAFGEFLYIENEGFYEVPIEQRLPDQYTEAVTILPEEVPYFITQELVRLLPYTENLSQNFKIPQQLKLVLTDAKCEKGRWKMRLVYRSEFGEVSAKEVDQAARGLKTMLLSDAGAIHLKDPRFQWLQKGAKKGEWIELNPLDWLKLKVFENIEVDEKASLEWVDFFEAFDASKQVDPPLDGLKSTLRPYQQVGARWLYALYRFNLSGLLCDDMGLGKTHQAMSIIAAIHNTQTDSKPYCIIVAPTSVMYHWEKLLKNFLPHLSVCLHHGPVRKKPALEQDILVTSYGVLRSDKADFKGLEFDLAIFDEMQVAKNQSSQIHKVLLNLDAKMRIGLSGTPIENRLLELKSLIDIVLPKFLPSDAIFKEMFVNPIEKGQSTERAHVLMRLIRPFILRRNKKEVLLDLPEKMEEVITVDLSDEQKEMYKNIYRGSREIIDQELEKDPHKQVTIHIFALLTKLKQICNHPALILKDVPNYASHQSGKWDLFVELLEEARLSGQKVVVFTQFLDMVAIFENYLQSQEIGYAKLHGATQDRKGEVERFQTDPECEVFIGTIQAAGVGIDLTKASVVIHYDRWWNFAKENQATDRVHRIGQTRGVQVFKFLSKDSIEEDIDWMIEKKKQLSEQILSYDHAEEDKQLSQDELMELMRRLDQSMKNL